MESLLEAGPFWALIGAIFVNASFPPGTGCGSIRKDKAVVLSMSLHRDSNQRFAQKSSKALSSTALEVSLHS